MLSAFFGLVMAIFKALNKSDNLAQSLELSKIRFYLIQKVAFDCIIFDTPSNIIIFPSYDVIVWLGNIHISRQHIFGPFLTHPPTFSEQIQYGVS